MKKTIIIMIIIFTKIPLSAMITDIKNIKSVQPEALKEIGIGSQSDFNKLNGTLNNILKSLSPQNNTILKVSFKAGVYKFNDQNKISLTSYDYPNTVIEFTTESQNQNTIIISDGDEYTINDKIGETETHYKCLLKSEYIKGTVFVNENFNLLYTGDTGFLSSNKINRAKSNVTVFDSLKKIARFKLPDELSLIKNKEADYFSNSILFYKSWYTYKYGTILRSDDEFIYFQYDNTMNLDSDYSFAKEFPLFYITNIADAIEKNKVAVIGDNIYIPKNENKVFVCNYNKLLTIKKTNFKKISINGLTLAGSSLFILPYNGDKTNLFDFSDSNNIEIKNNTFKNIGNEFVIKISSKNIGYPKSETATSNYVNISNNNVSDCYGGMFLSSAWNTSATNNNTSNTSIFNKFRGVMIVTSKNFYIAQNNISNYGGYYGITSTGYKTATNERSGIMEYNHIYFTEDYKENYLRNTVMDGGAIYIYTHQDNTICRYNIIHGIKGRRDYRGIFCDDGAYNFQLIGNLIYDISGYTIDSRYVPWKSNVNSEGYPTNVKNTIKDNILYGPYRFQGNPQYPASCKKGTNYVALTTLISKATTISNVDSLGPDININNTYAKTFQGTDFPDFIRSYIKNNQSGLKINK
ncbi:right-handed parallel beta-helix repeat-containing protein [Prevotella sp. 10(H)]|uniref:right-handed parallel beta-helix repeat-containing protein n=1 Tax=Prevotella sp. 10(H) TaxID=1158294 RepID=UPI0004A76707|nr:right-handed parallel beta-helix repeat-containing protein [Prevotella sp. 10(H)]